MYLDTATCCGTSLTFRSIPLLSQKATGVARRRRGLGPQRGSVRRPAAKDESNVAEATSRATIGEDAAVFSLQDQSPKSWAIFGVLLSSVLAGLYMASPLLTPLDQIHRLLGMDQSFYWVRRRVPLRTQVHIWKPRGDNIDAPRHLRSNPQWHGRSQTTRHLVEAACRSMKDCSRRGTDRGQRV